MANNLSRRSFLGFLSAVAAALDEAAGQQAVQTILQALGEGQRFEPGMVTEIARQLSRRPFAAPPNDLPDFLSNLTYEQYVGIRTQPNSLIWGGEGRGIAVEPLHRGFVFTNAVTLYIVEDGGVRRIAYDRSRFDYGRLTLPANVPDLGYSGFRLFTTFGNGALTEFAIFQGATFFRAVARGQNYGVVARALTLRPAETRGEEFPIFRAFWIERPSAGTNAVVLHAVIDSESATAAARMTLRPGDATIVDVEMTLFPRANLDHVGFGGMGSTYLFGPNDRRNVDDARAAVYESSGLQMASGAGEWIYRPLQNPETLQISAFVDRSPRGFGLVQRDRDYAVFQDDDQRFERKPTLWVEPLNDWGQGVVQLIEIPSDSEVNDNILAYWRPRGTIPSGSEIAVAYRQFWTWTIPDRPPLAIVAATRIGRGSTGRRRRFMIDFAGEGLDAAAAGEAKAALTTSPGTTHNLKVWPYPERKTLRVAFELDPGSENACEMRLVLEAGGKPISETWLYRWTP